MKCNFILKPCIEPELLRSYERAAKARGLPSVQCQERPSLAIVGGGPSLDADLLRSWQGDIWACGSPYPWLRERGIEATFFNLDPLDETVALARGARHAILSTTNYPAVFDVVESCEVFDIENLSAVTSASSAPQIAIPMGYSDITFFGCESSFERQTHAYKHEEWEAVIIVKVGEESFATKPQLLIQAQMLSGFIRLAPHIFKERSGGLLKALVRTPEYDVTHWNKAMHDLAKGIPTWMIHGDYGMMAVNSPQERYEAQKRGFTPCLTPEEAAHAEPFLSVMES